VTAPNTHAPARHRPILHTWRSGPLLAAVLLVVAVLAGCVKLDGEVTIADDDTFSGEAIVAVSQSWAVASGEDPYALQQIIEEVLAEDAAITSEPYEDETYIGAALTFTDVPIERVEEATNQALVITTESGGYEVAGRFDDLDTTAPDPSGDGEIDTPWVIDLAVTFPEAVTEHDGTLTGRTVSWERTPGEEILYASTAGDGFALPVPMPVLVLGLLLLGVGLWLFLAQRRRRRAGT